MKKEDNQNQNNQNTQNENSQKSQNIEQNIIIPGEKISNKPERTSYVYVSEGKTFSTVLGLKRGDRVIPFKGPYTPQFGDFVVGVVQDVKFTGYDIEINTPYPAFLHERMIRDKLDYGSIIFAKITAIDEVRGVDLGQAKVLKWGHLIEVPSTKIPRIIGKNNSMITMIRNATKCSIFVGKNGYIWVSHSGNTALAVAAIRKIAREAHISGLTDKIHAYLAESIEEKQPE